MPTLFERIISGELPAAIVHKDDRVTAVSRYPPPSADTHPRSAQQADPTVNDIVDEDEALIGHMVLVARDLARKEGLQTTVFASS